MSVGATSGGRPAPALEPLTVRIAEAVRLTGISRSRIYELMQAREIEHIKVGSSTLIPYDSLRRFIDRRRDPEYGRGGHG